MCLFAVDGTWSVNFNSKNKGKDQRGRKVGNSGDNIRSNTRKFFENCAYPDTKKFYWAGPGYGMSGADSWQIYHSVLNKIIEEVNNGNCDEIVMVGWSRGAAIISELTEGLEKLGETNSRRVGVQTGRGTRYRTQNNVIAGGQLPPVKFLGLFDAVSMIWRSSPIDRKWGEDITSIVEYSAHVVAGDRTGPVWGVDFYSTNPNTKAKRSEVLHLAQADHGGVGGSDSTATAQTSYEYIRNHATLAGVP